MDRTVELGIICNEISSTVTGYKCYCSQSPSPFLLKASDMFGQLDKFHNLMQSTFDNYVGYNRYLPVGDRKVKIFTAAERSDFNKETLVFITSMATEVKHLSRILDLKVESSKLMMLQHNKLIIAFLLNKLGTFTNLSEKMQRKQKSINVAPFRLLSGTYNTNDLKSTADTAVVTASVNSMPLTFFDKIINSTVSVADSTAINDITSTQTNSSFAQRYIDEIAPPSKMAVYRSVAATHKESLLQEARILQVRFSDDLNESHQMEREVGRISQLMSQFVSLVAGQSEVVGDIHGAAKLATLTVTEAGVQLQLTLTRSQSSQWYMVILVLGLSVLVLLLDGLTP